MDILMKLGPAFVVSFAIQRLLEVLDNFLDFLAGGNWALKWLTHCEGKKNLDDGRKARTAKAKKELEQRSRNNKTILLSVISLILAIVVVCIMPNIRILGALSVYNATDTNPVPYMYLDSCITVIFLSAGTESLNQLVKFLQYTKEAAKQTEKETIEETTKEAKKETIEETVK